MKRFGKSSGVTLLEILLVLAIAAMIIVMSVRYYQSATASQQANAAISQIQAITAAADQIAQGGGTYSAATQAKIASFLPGKALVSPWGLPITISGNKGNEYKVTLDGIPVTVCSLMHTRLSTDNHYKLDACPTTTANWAYTYVANP